MITVPIDKGIQYPLQVKENGGGGISKDRKVFPWNDMEIGDSFLFRDSYDFKQLTSARVACNQHSNNGKIFLQAEYECTIRIWRVR